MFTIVQFLYEGSNYHHTWHAFHQSYDHHAQIGFESQIGRLAVKWTLLTKPLRLRRRHFRDGNCNYRTQWYRGDIYITERDLICFALFCLHHQLNYLFTHIFQNYLSDHPVIVHLRVTKFCINFLTGGSIPTYQSANIVRNSPHVLSAFAMELPQSRTKPVEWLRHNDSELHSIHCGALKRDPFEHLSDTFIRYNGEVHVFSSKYMPSWFLKSNVYKIPYGN